MSSFKALVFDWDGTLFDSTASIVNALQQAFSDMQLPVPSREACCYVIGLGLTDAMRYLSPGLSEADYPRLVDYYRRYYLGRDHEIVLFDGVVEALQRYRQAGYFLAVATGKSRKGLDRALDVTGLRSLFDITRCADETFSKPHPEMLLQIMNYCDVAPDEVLMVGDTSHDMELARNAGTAAVAVTYGAHSGETLMAYAPLALVNSFVEFDQWLRSYI